MLCVAGIDLLYMRHNSVVSCSSRMNEGYEPYDNNAESAFKGLNVKESFCGTIRRDSMSIPLLDLDASKTMPTMLKKKRWQHQH